MKAKRDKYIKELMEKYNVYDKRTLNSVITQDEYNKLIELELSAVRGV